MNETTKPKKKATPKVMKLLDRSSGMMECKVCGAVHFANIRPHSNGNYYRGAWQCRHGCRLEEATPAAQ